MIRLRQWTAAAMGACLGGLGHAQSEILNFPGRTVNEPGPTRLLADVDRDGRLDQIEEIQETPSGILSPAIRVRRGDGMGGFGAGILSPAPTFLSSLRVADFDGDGLPDAVSAGPIGPDAPMMFFRGNGDGTFDPAVTLPFTVMTAIVPADLDNDGDLDVASGGSPFRCGRNDGHGSFQLVSSTTPEGYSTCAAVSVNDFDVDGHLDVLGWKDTGSFVSQSWFTTLGIGDCSFSSFQSGSTPSSSNEYGFALGDLNGDLRLDLLSPYGWWLAGDGAGGFAGLTTFVAEPSSGRAFLLRDLDEDHDLDFLYSEAESGALKVLSNDGSGGLQGPAVTIGCCLPVYEWVLADLDGDLADDLIALTRTAVFRGSDTGFNFPRVGRTGATLMCGFEDADADGRAELWIAERYAIDPVTGVTVGGPRVRVVEPDSNGDFQTVHSIDITPSSIFTEVGRFGAIRDLDGDGATDVVVAQQPSLLKQGVFIARGGPMGFGSSSSITLPQISISIQGLRAVNLDADPESEIAIWSAPKSSGIGTSRLHVVDWNPGLAAC